MANAENHAKRTARFFRDLGPGVVTGAADDDPSGISTYSVTGATFGLAQLWTVLLTFPLMAGVQLMCARLALVRGEGLAAVIRKRYSKWVLWFACSLLAIANIINIGADLAGMSDALKMTTGIPTWIWLPILAIGIVTALIWGSYRKIAKTFKWLTLVLFAYVFAAFLSKPNWPEVLKATFLPQIEWTSNYLLTLLAILGTTITPYMFFWQAAQEVEEQREHGHSSLRSRMHISNAEIKEAQIDVLTGMGWAGIAMYFIILTTATTLHAKGITNIETAQQAAEALRPLAGNLAYLLFTLGIVGTGILAVPVLAGSAGYAVAEAMHWRGSLNSTPKVGRKFYTVIAIAILLGLALDIFGVPSVKALFYSAVVNGMLAPPLVLIVTLLTSDKKLMGVHANGVTLKFLGYATFAIMGAATITMIISWLR